MIRVKKSVFVADVSRQLEKGQTVELPESVEARLVKSGYAVAAEDSEDDSGAGGSGGEGGAGGAGGPSELSLDATNDELKDGLSGLSEDELQAFWDQHEEADLKAMLVDRFGEAPKDGWTKGQMENMLEKRLGVKD